MIWESVFFPLEVWGPYRLELDPQVVQIETVRYLGSYHQIGAWNHGPYYEERRDGNLLESDWQDPGLGASSFYYFEGEKCLPSIAV